MAKIRIATALAALALAVGPVLAHHGWGSYDANRGFMVRAELLEVQYRNPHAQVVVEHDGQRWDVILAPTSRMEARGLPENALEVGKNVMIEGYPKTDGTPEMRAERITVDGITVELR